jgi:pilus assembly protein CpaC
MNKLFRTTLAAAMLGIGCLVAAAGFVTAPAAAQSADEMDVNHHGNLRIGYSEPLPAHRAVAIGLNKTMVVEVPRDLRDVVVSNPEYLDAVVQSSRRVFLIAKKLGAGANAFFFDENGEQILTVEVKIEYDVGPLERLLERVIPGANITVEILNDTVVLTGTVNNPADAARASDIASRFIVRAAEKNERYDAKVINLLRVEAKEQVLLKVQVAEVDRESIKRLGVNWYGEHLGDSAIGGGSANGFPVTAGLGGNTNLFGVFGPSNNLANCATQASIQPGSCLSGTLQAFERTGLMRTLAEPTLTAISGETASFLAGGEFPVPVAQDRDTITVDWKPFGVGLSFTPMVLSEGRINLKINTEVSELSTEGAVSFGNGGAIQGLKVRRANTTVELPSGGSLVMAGLISDDTRQNIDGVPELKNLPILGTLFRSRDFRKKETELVVIVTPYTVNAVAANKLATPVDNLEPASDARATFLGQLNRVYGRSEQLPAGHYDGNFGFIVE